LAELDGDRDVELRLGDPVDEVGDRAVAATFAPVPGFRRMADRMRVAELHPWPWLRVPTFGSVSSFTAWRRGLGQAGQDNAERTATAPG
jgi:deoxyribodipyrimidine photo-lyase